MAKVKTESINMDGSEKNELSFKFDVHVNQKGLFTATIPKEIADRFKKANITVYENRSGNIGFFEADNYSDLISEIKVSCKEYLSRELVSEVIVIKYIIHTACSYCFNDAGEIVPNGNWVKDFQTSEEKMWRGGTEVTHANKPAPYGLNVFCKPYWKKVYKYKSGTQKTEYSMLNAFGASEVNGDCPNLKWMEGIVSMSEPPGKLMEIEYSESVAGFFVSLIKSICKLNEQIKDMIKPEKIKFLSDNNLKFIG